MHDNAVSMPARMSIPVALIGIVIAISGPSMLIAWLKLRQRSLGPILDASGWAINGRMKVSVRLGGMLSQTPRACRRARSASHPIRTASGAASRARWPQSASPAR
jgi:hypothetical protein